MTTGVTTPKNLGDDIVKAMRALTKSRLLVGVPAANADRPDEEGKSDPITNAQIGYWMETGVPEKNIPARPHLVPGIEAVRDNICKRMVGGAKNALQGDAEGVDKAFHAAGLIAVGSVQKLIMSGIPPALSPDTIYNRMHRKESPRTGTLPLVDHGFYFRSITYVIAKGNN